MNDAAEIPPEPAPAAAQVIQLPVRAGDIIPFTPSCAAELDPPPVFRLRVPSIGARAAFRRELGRRGGASADPGRVSVILRKGILECIPADRQPDMMAVLDEWDQAVAAKGQVDGVDLNAVLRRYYDISTDIYKLYPPFAELSADLQFVDALQGLIAVQSFVVDWTGVVCADADGAAMPLEIERERGLNGNMLVTERCLDQIPRDQWVELQQKAYALLGLGHQAIKNSAPPPSTP